MVGAACPGQSNTTHWTLKEYSTTWKRRLLEYPLPCTGPPLEACLVVGAFPGEKDRIVNLQLELDACWWVEWTCSISDRTGFRDFAWISLSTSGHLWHCLPFTCSTGSGHSCRSDFWGWVIPQSPEEYLRRDWGVKAWIVRSRPQACTALAFMGGCVGVLLLLLLPWQ